MKRLGGKQRDEADPLSSTGSPRRSPRHTELVEIKARGDDQDSSDDLEAAPKTDVKFHDQVESFEEPDSKHKDAGHKADGDGIDEFLDDDKDVVDEKNFKTYGYCDSWYWYWGELWSCPRLECPMLTICCCGEHHWRRLFGRWNIIYCQMMLFTFPLYLIVIVIIGFVNAVSAAILPAVLQALTTHSAVSISSLFLSHNAHYWLVQQRGCCQDRGPAYWLLVYLLMSFFFLLYHPPIILQEADEEAETGEEDVDQGFNWGLLMYTVYSPLFIPFWYISHTLWHMGAKVSIRNGCCGAISNLKSSITDAIAMAKHSAQERKRLAAEEAAAKNQGAA